MSRPTRSPLRLSIRLLIVILLAGLNPAQLGAQNTSVQRVPDLTREPTLFVVGYAHLDTEWRWNFETSGDPLPGETWGPQRNLRRYEDWQDEIRVEKE